MVPLSILLMETLSDAIGIARGMQGPWSGPATTTPPCRRETHGSAKDRDAPSPALVPRFARRLRVRANAEARPGAVKCVRHEVSSVATDAAAVSSGEAGT